MQTSYRVLNISNPNLTESCWLCYGIEPPFYEAIGDTRKPKRSNTTIPAECNWGQETMGVTLTQVSGSGRCIGKVPEELTYLCNYTLTANKSKQPAKWLIPAVNARWICKDTGVTPCVSLDIFRDDTHFCIQVLIVPKILYHPESFMYENQINQEHHLSKREPVTALTLAAIMILGGAGVGTGITSLIKQSQDFTALRIAVDEDLVRIEKSISALEKSVRSLSEVVLQNRRGLDLLLLPQGGLCAALKEECCVYADHTGVVRDTMTKLHEGLEKRRREREAQRSWYESWFNQSPWLTTLLSTIAGPLILIVLGLTFGPSIFNKILEIVHNQLEAAHLMIIRAKYEPLEQENALILSQKALQQFDEQNP